MTYLSEGVSYQLSYQELKKEYLRFLRMSDVEFVDNIGAALHLACIISFLKEIPTYNCVGDKGIVHELVHVLTLEEYRRGWQLKEVRNLFKQTLKLA